MKLLDEIKAELRPSAAEKRLVAKETREVIKKLGSVKGAKAVLGGSGAKGTWISGSVDVDIFVCYNYSKFSGKSNDLSDMLHPILKKKFSNVKRVHGSRDYFQIKKGKVLFEVVPILGVRKAQDAKNITDVSPLHAKWVRKEVKNTDEILLLKSFCKAQGIYGAESHIKGFSGYVCEILIYKYGSFLKALRAAAKWKEPVIIDVENHYRNSTQVMRELNRSKLSPLIIIDPVQKERNAGAALSTKSFEKFRSSATKFIKRPSKELFVTKELSEDNVKGKNTIVVSAELLRGKNDVVASKALKSMNYIMDGLKKNDFAVKSGDWHWSRNRALFWITLEKLVIEKKKRISGPPAKNELHAKRFRKAHRGAFVKKGKMYAVASRKFTDANKLVKKLLKDEYVTNRVKSAEVV